MEYREEKKIEEYLVAQAKKMGAWALKFVSPGLAGVPDRVVLYKGRAIFIELKAPNGKPTPRQKKIHSLFTRNGFEPLICNSKAEVDEALQYLEVSAL